MKSLILSVALLGAAPIAAADITVAFSEEFTETLEEDYGVREGEYLAGEVSEDLSRELDKAGLDLARVDVTIIKAVPNRPTMQQLGAKPGLDFGRSISIGGMKLSATAYDASGAKIDELEWGWFERDIRFAVGSTTWSDANTASRRFAKRFAETLED